MLRIDMLPARQGDAIWIEYGSREQPWRLLVDGGPPHAGQELKRRILALPEGERHFELLVVTHIDTDHIGGVLEILQDDDLGVTFTDIWFNGWRHLPGALEALGPVEGEKLSALLSARPWNKAFAGEAVCLPDEGAPPLVELTGGLTIRVLGPRKAELAALLPVWEKVVIAAGLKPGQPSAPTERELGGLEALGSAGLPDVDRLAAARFFADTAPANGSSVVLLVSYQDDLVLVCGDAFPGVVREGIERVLATGEHSRLALSALKVPHHGSRRNLNMEMLEILESPVFLFSSNGERTDHPNAEAVARVITTQPQAQLCFNYQTPFNKIWQNKALRGRYGYQAVYPGQGEEGLAVDLQPV
jgi:hypothetical protein